TRVFSPIAVAFRTFFFQAEDGIRDLTVTGVQTCALPILPALSVTPEGMFSRFFGRLTNSDIELESEDFNRAFRVTCPNRRFASEIGRASCRETAEMPACNVPSQITIPALAIAPETVLVTP